MKGLRFGLLSIKKNFQNAKELKSAFITSIFGMILSNGSFIFLWFNFGLIVGNINGWGKYDIIGLYGFTMTSYGLVCSFLYGIINLPKYISSGNFDKYLLTPKNILLKVSTSAISTSAIGDLLFGIICVISYIFLNNLDLLHILSYILLLFVSSIVFFSFATICMSLSFYFMEGENISNGLMQLFITPSLYHGGAFNKVLKIIFVFVIPALMFGSIPIEIINDITLLKLIGAIVFAIIWFIMAILFFYKSLKKYESNNFFGFSG